MGVKDPEATFSACFGAAFMVWHPTKYAELLAAHIARHGSQAWLVNTGWSGGGYGVGKRMSLKYTRAILDAIHDGSLAKAATASDPVFGLEVPKTCANVPAEVLWPKNTWQDKAAYDQKQKHLAGLFVKNFAKYADQASAKIRAAAPRV
jgi:phosphoenolpyruvate carboxykinase (ATP)